MAYVWRWGRVTFEVVVFDDDGDVVAGLFLDGEPLRWWDRAEGEA